LPFPDVVVQLLLGIAIGPQVLGLATVDPPLRVLSLVGLSFLLFLAGLELDIARLRGVASRFALSGFLCSLALAYGTGHLLQAAGLIASPLLIAVILSATALGIVLPVVKDAGQLDEPLGRMVVAGASVAEVAPILLLSVFFSDHAAGIGSQLTLLAAFVGAVVVVLLALVGVERSARVSGALLALQSTTAQIRVRAAVALLMGFAALAAGFGLEAILGAFVAGAAVSLLDRDEQGTHTLFRVKLQAIGFGGLIPFFYVATGIALDVRSLLEPTTLVRVPVFLAAVLLVRSVLALLYRRWLGSTRATLAAGLLQGTTLSIPVIGGSIGVGLGVIRPENYVALVAAGAISVIVFPAVALALATRRDRPHVAEGP
jgi:Kef-type K+ transport system membrane component KefB